MFSGKISKSSIYPSLDNSEQKFQKNVFFKVIGPRHTLILQKLIWFVRTCGEFDDLDYLAAFKNYVM